MYVKILKMTCLTNSIYINSYLLFKKYSYFYGFVSYCNLHFTIAGQ